MASSSPLSPRYSLDSPTTASHLLPATSSGRRHGPEDQHDDDLSDDDDSDAGSLLDDDLVRPQLPPLSIILIR